MLPQSPACQPVKMDVDMLLPIPKLRDLSSASEDGSGSPSHVSWGSAGVGCCCWDGLGLAAMVARGCVCGYLELSLHRNDRLTARHSTPAFTCRLPSSSFVCSGCASRIHWTPRPCKLLRTRQSLPQWRHQTDLLAWVQPPAAAADQRGPPPLAPLPLHVLRLRLQARRSHGTPAVAWAAPAAAAAPR